MKTILTAVGFTAILGCGSQKEIQVEMVRAELVKIDTVFRQPNEQKLLTWRGQDKIEYVSFASMNQTYILGTSMMVLRRR